MKRILRKAADNGISFKAQIEMDLDAAVDGIATGEIQSMSGNGLSTTFSSSGLTPTEAQDLLNEIDDRYTTAKADLESRSVDLGGANADSLIQAEMLAMMTPVRRMFGDFQSLRCA